MNIVVHFLKEGRKKSINRNKNEQKQSETQKKIYNLNSEAYLMWPLLPLLLQCDVFPRSYSSWYCPRPKVCFTTAASLVRVTIQHSNISQSYLTKEKKRRKKREICFAKHRINKGGNFPASVPQKVSCFASLGQVYGYFPDIAFNSRAHVWMYMHTACSGASHPGTIKFSPRLLWDHHCRW